jgi:hypothetical protein
MKQSLFACAAALVTSALMGCTPGYDHLDFAQRTSPPLPADLSANGVTIPVGIAVGIAPIAIDDSGDPMEDVNLSLVSSSSSILGLDGAGDDGFVIYGVAPGQATISVFVDGTPVDTIPAVVIEDP